VKSSLGFVSRSASAGVHFRAEAIVVAARWYLRYGLLYRIVEDVCLPGVGSTSTM
jgi:transposase-like protein